MPECVFAVCDPPQLYAVTLSYKGDNAPIPSLICKYPIVEVFLSEVGIIDPVMLGNRKKHSIECFFIV